ncbi:hypothetical protein Tco_0939137 [Tanacetum coccineum]|uniref:Integrase, catalytic region, zinc finger, CCHC-type, peptidase aspartic, catalytic n=1 Tax=Tanacetum coccineum TaxID=301880 RepID=A0ABQ5DLK7_9ASTR
MTTPITTSTTDSQMHNNIMAGGSRDHPPMLAIGRYTQWQSRFLRYIDTRPNGDALRKCILEGPYTPSIVTIPAVPATNDSTGEAIHFLLTRIGDEIYSTVDACKTAHEIKFTSHNGESMESYYSRFYKMMNEMIRNNLTVTMMQIKVQFLQQLQPEWSRFVTIVKQQLDLDTVSYHKLFDVLKQYQKEVNEIHIYKPTNNNLRTSSNSKNKNVDTSPRYKNDNQTGQFGNQRTVTVAGARETVQYDAEYNMFDNERQYSEKPESISNTCVVEKVDSNVILDSLDMCDNDIQTDQNAVKCDDKHVALANLIANLKLDNSGKSNSIQDSCLIPLQNKQTELETYKTLNDKLECLIKEKTKVITDLKLKEEKDIDKMISMEKQLKFLNEIVYKRNQSIQTIHMLAPKIPYDTSDPANRFVLDREETLTLEKESRSKLNKDLEKHSHDHFRAPTAHDMEILIKTCLMPLALKKQNNSFKFVHELKQEMHADLKYVESLEKEIDELEYDKAEFSNMYDILLQECVSTDVMYSYLHSLSDLDAHTELQCLYLHKVKECKCLAQKLLKQTKIVKQVKNDTVCKEKASNVFLKEREQYFKIQDLKVQLQDKNISKSELKKLIEKRKGKSVETKFDKPFVVRQPIVQRIPKPSVLGKLTPFSDSLEKKSFSKTKSVPKTNVLEGLSKPVTTQILPQTERQAVRNINVIKLGMYRIDTRTTQTRAPQFSSRNTNPHVSTSIGVIHITNVSRPKLKSTQMKDKAAGFENRPPMLNKENYVPRSSRLLWYDKSRPNGKLIYNSIMNGPYVRRMIPEPGDAYREVPVEADDQAIQTILLDLPKDIYAVVDSCETAQEIWLRVQQMMKSSDIRIQEKKAKLFNEWEMFTSTDGESIKSFYHRFSKLMNDFKRNKHFPEKIVSNLKFLNNLQPQWSRHVTIVHQTKDLNTADYTQLYDFLKYNQKEVNDLRAERLAKTHDPLNSNRNGNVVAAQVEGDAIGNNVRPRRRDVAYLQYQLLIAQKEEAGIQIHAEEFNLMASAADLDEIEEVNANCILMANLQQASTSGTQTDKAPVYNSDGSTELLEPIPEPHQVQQHDSNVIYEVSSVEQDGGTVDHHPSTIEETRAYFESLYNNLAIEVEKVNSINRKMKETNVDLTTELARYKNQEKCFKISQEKYDKLERCYQKSVYQEQCLTEKINALHLSSEAANLFETLKSLGKKKLMESLAKRTRTLELEIETSLRAVVRRVDNIAKRTRTATSHRSNTMIDRVHYGLRVVATSIKMLSRRNTIVYPNLLWCVELGLAPKHMTGNLKLLINFVWKFLGTVRFGNDHVAAILGFGDLQWGNILITSGLFRLRAWRHNILRTQILLIVPSTIQLKKNQLKVNWIYCSKAMFMMIYWCVNVFCSKECSGCSSTTASSDSNGKLQQLLTQHRHQQILLLSYNIVQILLRSVDDARNIKQHGSPSGTSDRRTSRQFDKDITAIPMSECECYALSSRALKHCEPKNVKEAMTDPYGLESMARKSFLQFRRLDVWGV